MSTMSSGTKKINAFIFLAIEMASLARPKISINGSQEIRNLPFCLLSS